MTRYEYRFVDLHATAGRDMLHELNALGAAGWRVVNLDSDTTAHWRMLMEREIPEEAEREIDDGRRA